MTKISGIMIEYILKHVKVNLESLLEGKLLDFMDNSSNKKTHPFISNFKTIWADNGDFISKLYSGTGSTTSSLTRKGKTGFFGMLDHGMKSIERFYIANFEDRLKQEIIDLILGTKTKIHNCKKKNFIINIKYFSYKYYFLLSIWR